MDITGIGPQQLLIYSQIQLQLCTEAQIVCVQNLLHGKLTKEIKSTRGQHRLFYNMNSLLLPDGSISSDPVQIHHRLTEAFAEHFICPQQHSCSPLQDENAIEHEKFLTDKAYFKSVVAIISEKIPGEALDSIWYGILHVSKKHSSARTWRKYSKRQ